jgi:hypothetical protein
MPDFGLVTEDDLGSTAPTIAPLYGGLPWQMPGTRVVKMAYEVELDVVRSVLPVTLSRPTTPFATLVVYDVSEGPFGPFRMAAQCIACRYRTYGRVYVLQAVIDNPIALAGFREVWSYPAKPGVVEIEGGPDEHNVRGRVLSAAGAEIASWELGPIEGADAERVTFDTELTVRIESRFSPGPASPPVLVQINRAYALRDPRRGPISVRFSTPDPAYPWGILRSTNTIVGIDTTADLEWAPTAHVLPYEYHSRVAGTV